MTLWSINQSIEAILNGYEAVDTETGEVYTFKDIDNLMMERHEKIESVGLYIKNITAEANAIKAEEEALAKRRKAIERKIDSLKWYILCTLDDADEFKTSRIVMKVRNNTAVEITDLEAVPEEFVKIIPEARQADKMAIKKAINSGAEIAGAHLVNSQSLSIK